LNRLVEILHEIGPRRILVLGDVMLDRYTWGDATRISPEAPIPVLRAEEQQIRLGGAGCVATLLAGLGARVTLAGAVADDPAGRLVRRLTAELGIDDRLLLDVRDRVTTTKHRFIGRAAGRHAHQMLRVDEESPNPLPSANLDRLAASLGDELAGCDALVVSDYAKGVCSPEHLPPIIAAARASGLPCVIDPARRDDYSHYAGATIITPNRAEAALAAKLAIDSPAAGLAAAQTLCQRYQVDAAAVTIDRDGIVVADSQGLAQHFPCRPCDVYDITGAGDTVLAIFGLCQAAGVSLADAARLANIAAGIQVKRFGAAPIHWAEVVAEVERATLAAPPKVVSLSELVTRVDELRAQKKSIVFTNGCFDLLHAGHVRCLQEAAALGDVLIVAVNSDASVKQLKGELRPLMPQADRTAVLAALSCVDLVVVFDEPTPEGLLERVRPDVLVKGGTYRLEEIAGRDIVEKYGGRVHLAQVVEGLSTTALVESLRAKPSR
jgi:D-beta-D-heptose 7-phosphate kinase/D-beta-D-heptose 1-phosphate adenosyltransferase